MTSFVHCTWLNEPKTWEVSGDQLRVVTDAKTDFWRGTYYGFIRDNGHFLAAEIAGDFTAQLRIRARYDELYDQAGIMIRIDESNWVKAGLESSDGLALLSSVLTAGQSDWATGIYHGDPNDFWMRATVKDGVLRLQVSANGRSWALVRLAPFLRAATYLVGPMCCTPERAGLEVLFSSFELGAPLNKDLHDLS